MLNDEYSYTYNKDNITNILNLAENNTSNVNIDNENNIPNDAANTGKDKSTSNPINEKDIPRKLADPNKPNPHGWEFQDQVDDTNEWEYLYNDIEGEEEDINRIKKFLSENQDQTKTDPSVLKVLNEYVEREVEKLEDCKRHESWQLLKSLKSESLEDSLKELKENIKNNKK